MQDDGKAPQRLGEYGLLTRPFGRRDRGFVALNRFGGTRVPLSVPRFVQQIRSGTRCHQATT